MMSSRFPPIAEVLPHAGRMVLLARILDHAEGFTTCGVEIMADSPFLDPDGAIPPWVGLEYMTQCIAAHAGLRARARGEPIKPGFFIGSRRVDFRTDGFRVGQTLSVTANHVWGDKELASFACVLRDRLTHAVLVEGTLKVFLPPTVSALIRGGR